MLSTKKCVECGEIKNILSFHKNYNCRDGRLNKCSKCRKYRCETSNPVTKRRNQLKHKYGISLEEYNDLLVFQSGTCAICNKKEILKKRNSDETRPLAVDHCHETGKIRGLLCSACNSGIGYLRESPKLLKRAAGYCFLGGFDEVRQEI